MAIEITKIRRRHICDACDNKKALQSFTVTLYGSIFTLYLCRAHLAELVEKAQEALEE